MWSVSRLRQAFDELVEKRDWRKLSSESPEAITADSNSSAVAGDRASTQGRRAALLGSSEGVERFGIEYQRFSRARLARFNSASGTGPSSASSSSRNSPRASRSSCIRSVTCVTDVIAGGQYDSVPEDGRATEDERGGMAETCRAVA